MHSPVTIFGVTISPVPNKTRKVIEWHYSIQSTQSIIAGFYADSLEGAIVHIISIQNNREQYIGAVYELLGIGKKLYEVITEGE